ncbi:MAG: hypothetical protein H8E68_01640 [Kiritimatiellaeota bacterium]|nr:hypothetical protein [Kiritimatiellota bacterium]
MSHSVFKDQKKSPTWLPDTTGFSVGAASNLRKLRRWVNRFFHLFFRTISCSILTRFTACFVLNKAGHHTHISLLGNPFFKLFFRTMSCPISTGFAACFVSNKAGDSTHKKKSDNPFLPFFSQQTKKPLKTQ